MPDPDRLLYAQVCGICARHAGSGTLTGGQEAAAVAELTATAGGRPDLLAERAPGRRWDPVSGSRTRAAGG